MHFVENETALALMGLKVLLILSEFSGEKDKIFYNLGGRLNYNTTLKSLTLTGSSYDSIPDT